MSSSSRALTEGTSHRWARAASRSTGLVATRSRPGGAPARGCLVEALGAASNRAKAKRRKAHVAWGEAADGVEPRYPSGARVYWRRFGVKLHGFTRGDLSASAARKRER